MIHAVDSCCALKLMTRSSHEMSSDVALLSYHLSTQSGWRNCRASEFRHNADGKCGFEWERRGVCLFVSFAKAFKGKTFFITTESCRWLSKALESCSLNRWFGNNSGIARICSCNRIYNAHSFGQLIVSGVNKVFVWTICKKLSLK